MSWIRDLLRRILSIIISAVISVASFFGLSGLFKTTTPADAQAGFHLTVVDQAGHPWSQCLVALSWENDERAKFTDDAGYFHASLVPGKHTVTVNCPATAQPKVFDVTLPDQHSFALTLTMPRG
ncbi:hypothetical protein P4N68_09390 [Corynebacterium felinum]|uniref:Membrane protein n=1 Tax=Corynebacterium felinum TaxID=131318 RepID=A0ABU2B8W8_9CORY|nr:carboxypeptidase-like regulatory domain-containing protein [Corynebacterium felinum]MDF5821288.1 hypothetical protein [Corynebacterium felinum]MDR7354831.1 putative membrane protein [Corynebacterium felinum]WJY94191.1 hypothetical protein CFELI_02745 [Corynebacterium felinum]